MDLTVGLGLLTYSVSGWVLVYQDLMDRLQRHAYELFDEFPQVYDSVPARMGLLREQRLLGNLSSDWSSRSTSS